MPACCVSNDRLSPLPHRASRRSWTYGADCPTYFNYTNRCFDNYNGDQRPGDTHNVRYREWGVCLTDLKSNPPFICTPGADCVNQTMY